MNLYEIFSIIDFVIHFNIFLELHDLYSCTFSKSVFRGLFSDVGFCPGSEKTLRYPPFQPAENGFADGCWISLADCSGFLLLVTLCDENARKDAHLN